MLTLVTVNYQDPSPTLRLIEDLNHQTSHNFSLVIIDNASAPEHKNHLRDAADQLQFPCVLLWNDTNTGFAGGTNKGLKHALEMGTEWTLIINNDTRVDASFIADLTTQIAGLSSGIFGLPLVEHGKRIVSGKVQWLRTELGHDTEAPTAHSYIIGASILIDRTTLATLGYLDERYFLYFEDVAYTLQARRMNIHVDFLSTPFVTHTPSQSTSKLSSPLLLRYHMRNAILLNQTFGPWWVRIITPLWALGVIVRNVVKYLCIPSVRPQARALILGAWDGLTHRYGILH